MNTADFFEQNPHALREVNVVLRDSLGSLAIAILQERFDIKTMAYGDMLDELDSIITELHKTYQQQYRG
ncbi:hypothetical protein [Veillonella sp.]|uniref:hypothetical protein n=1 Tax=Veillonella sp. TaxID=1926307 RepID=UPI0025EC5334|nr:hypothetical protein [Veillonella sp.]